VSSDALLEPGIFGILRPVLLWPRRIAARLGDEQVEAILAHELCHVRRRDNLAAAMHAVVQAAFWFHPVVWWIGARLVAERERACDEEVVRLGSDPRKYAETILRTCQLSIESPHVWMAGVTGSDLKKRIEQILTNEAGAPLNLWRRLLLGTAGVAAIAIPVAMGVVNVPPLRAQAPDSAPVSHGHRAAGRVDPLEAVRRAARHVPCCGRRRKTIVPSDALFWGQGRSDCLRWSWDSPCRRPR
jgi:beta-lactamase regulating signal transducer with metallopeptidase domain